MSARDPVEVCATGELQQGARGDHDLTVDRGEQAVQLGSGGCATDHGPHVGVEHDPPGTCSRRPPVPAGAPGVCDWRPNGPSGVGKTLL